MIKILLKALTYSQVVTWPEPLNWLYKISFHFLLKALSSCLIFIYYVLYFKIKNCFDYSLIHMWSFLDIFDTYMTTRAYRDKFISRISFSPTEFLKPIYLIFSAQFFPLFPVSLNIFFILIALIYFYNISEFYYLFFILIFI